MKIRHKTWLFAATSALALASAGAVNAQTLPPERYTVDAHGVDLVRKEWTPTSASFSIGGETGLSYGRVLLGSEWWDAASGGISDSGSIVRVTVDGVTEVFDAGPTGFTPREKNGSTLVESNFGDTYTYQRAGGTVWQLDRLDTDLRPGPFTHSIVSRTEPNGLRTDYNYVIDSFIPSESPHPNPVRIARLQSYQNNAGYQIHYEFETNTLNESTVAQWQIVNKVMGINLAVDYCDKAAFTCTSLTRTWPSVAFSEDDSVPFQTDLIITDQAGTETVYRTRNGLSGRVNEVFIGASPTPLVSVASNLLGDVASVTDASGTWDYTFLDTFTDRTATVEGPMGEETEVVSDLATGLVTSATQTTSASPAASRTWSWTYDAGYRVDVATGPEGETTDYDYDNRGNVTQVTQSPKTGSSEADIVTSATYSSSCANPVVCNLPSTTTDATGQVTNYSWDATHGGPLIVTMPAATTGGVRPRNRYHYEAQTAQFKNSSGVVVAAPTSVTLPVEISSCAVNASCNNTANEVLTTIGYGVTTGVANNLNVASVTRGSGSVPAMAVTAATWTPDGDLATVDGPLSGTGDTTQYRYDTSRRMVGVVGPDPDGAGAGLNRAQRITRNDRGQPTLTEVGTTAGYTDPNWAAFSPLLKSSVAYDDMGRPVEGRQLSAAGVAASVQQVTYDDAGRVSCSATRMNPATFGSLPSSACTAATAGGFGADRIIQTTYDLADRPLSMTTGVGTAEAMTQSQTYTVGGQIGSLTDGDGNVSIFEYDGFNRAKRLRYPNATGGGTSTTDDERTTYDAYGRLSTFQNRSGQTTTYTYDNLSRVTFVDAPPMVDDHYFQYDLLGRRTSISTTGTLPVTCDAQTTCLTWDPLSRLKTETTDLGAMTYGYDAAGRRTSITWSDGFAADYAYDLSGAVTAISQHPSGGSATQVAAYGWNNLGQPTSLSRASGAGASTAWGYDAWGRMSSLAHDASGTSQDVTFGYSFNPAGQIVGRTVSNASYLYGASPTGATAYAVDGLNQLDSIDSVAVTHDSRGNVTGVLGRTYGYDRLDRMISANAGAGASLFTYDPTSRLATSRVGGVTSQRQYAGDQLVAEYNPATGAMTKRYIPGLGLDDVAVAYDGSGTSTRNWQLADERGSVIALAGSTGAVSNINTYDEYGVPASGNVGRFQYTGQQWLPEAGAYYYRARNYMPQTGRFLQTDPIGYAGGQNLYAYVGDDPINNSDALGLIARPGKSGMVCIGDVHYPSSAPSGRETCYQSAGFPVSLLLTWGDGTQGTAPGGPPSESSGGSYEPLACHPRQSSLSDWADAAGNLSDGAGLVALTAGAAAVLTSWTGVGGVSFGAIAGAAEFVSFGGALASASFYALDGRGGEAFLALTGAVPGFAAGRYIDRAVTAGRMARREGFLGGQMISGISDMFGEACG